MRDFLRQRLVAVIVVLVVIVLLSANRVATFLTDLWWYQAIEAGEVFTGIIWTRVLLGVVTGFALAVLIAASLLIARRLRPLVVPSTPQQAVIENYRSRLDPYLPWAIAGVAVLFGIFSGVAAATQWDTVLLWLNGGEFGATDPQFNRDIGFYVFDLPFWQFVQGWLFSSLLLVGLLTVGAHVLLGGIRPDAPGDKVIPAVKAHLSVLLALILAARGWGYWLDRYELNFSPRGTVTGASYTDVNAELPALYLLLAVTAVAIVLTLANLRRRGFLLPGAAIALLVLASILLQGAYPAIVQRLQVDPQELARERPYIQENLEATREAYGLADAGLRPFEVSNELTRPEVEDNRVTIDNVRLWSPGILETTYSELQELRPYYAFDDVDVDRYEIDGELRQVMLSARELQQNTIPSGAQTWQNLALTYTHGLGVVASQVNVADSEGQPVFLASDIPTQGVDRLVPDQQSIYYGETETPRFSIVDTEQPELHYEESGTQEQVEVRYDGEGGVVLGNRLSRLAYALRFSDPNIVLSGLPDDDSRILYHRVVSERVRKVAPYLTLDSDPYPVVHDGRIKWVVDAYTTSVNYPYSERRIFETEESAREVNYVRNSVKAVVDAYDGDVTLYQMEDDPIVEAWRSAFESLYVDVEDAPEGLRENFRYPQDQFRLQSELYSTYHIPEPAAFYNRADAWNIPRDPAVLQNQPQASAADAPMDPYYLLMRLPGEQDEEFVLIQPYLAAQRPNMISWLAGRSDPEHYGELSAVRFPSNQTILGPQQAQARIEQNDTIAEYITLRDQAGSDVIRGSMLVIPVEDSILYVEPLFIQNEQAEIPQLERVVIVLGGRVVMEATLEQAIAALLGEDTGDVEVPDPSSEDPDETVTEQQLIQRVLDAFTAADEALSAGDLGEYQNQLDRAQEAASELADLRGVEPEPTPTPTDGGTAPDDQASPAGDEQTS